MVEVGEILKARETKAKSSMNREALGCWKQWELREFPIEGRGSGEMVSL